MNTVFRNSSGHFGGTLLKNSNAKVVRPLQGKSFLEVVLKSRRHDFFKNSKSDKIILKKTFRQMCAKYKMTCEQLRIGKQSLSFRIYLKNKKSYHPFIRSLTGALALRLSKANKFKALKQSFWICRPWTCVIKSIFKKNDSKEFSRMLNKYLISIKMKESRVGTFYQFSLSD